MCLCFGPSNADSKGAEIFHDPGAGSQNSRHGSASVFTGFTSSSGWVGADDGILYAKELLEPELSGSQVHLVRILTSLILMTALLYTHRVFFAQAIKDCPHDPMKSQYAPSFFSAYRSATEYLDCLSATFSLFPAQIARFWALWTHAFSSAARECPISREHIEG